MYNISMLTIPINQDSSPEAVIELLFKLKVKDVMTKDVITATPQKTMREIQQMMKSSGITGVPIIEGNTLSGIVSMDDIVNAFDNNRIDESCEKYMTHNIIVLQETMPLSFAVSYFNKYGFGRFPVLNSENQLTGIVTASDVLNALLLAMNKEVERLEKEAQNNLKVASSITEEDTSKLYFLKKMQDMENQPNRVIEFKTEPFNFEIAGQASTELKKILKNIGIETALIRRISIASYELEINQVVHSTGGIMRYYISPERVRIEATDFGPGIEDTEVVLCEGYTTATERIRSLGFGAGMGLPNAKRVSDFFSISSSLGKGTTVKADFNLTQNKLEEK